MRHRVNEFTVVGELVAAGAGVALLPRWTASIPAGVVLRPLADVSTVRHIDALVRPEHTLRPEVGLVLDELRRLGRALRSARPARGVRGS